MSSHYLRRPPERNSYFPLGFGGSRAKLFCAGPALPADFLFVLILFVQLKVFLLSAINSSIHEELISLIIQIFTLDSVCVHFLQ